MPKPITLRTANVSIRALLAPQEIELREEPFPSVFLNHESEAKFFGPTWDEVIAQVIRHVNAQTIAHTSND